MKTILLIEDDLSLTRMYQRIFDENSGFILKIAWDGEEGLRSAKTVMPDLVLLDIILPKIDGIEVLRRIKKDIKTMGIPVIMLTNLSDSVNVADAITLGARGYLVKANYTPDEILQQVRDFLNQKI
ncbi:MAG: response regulator [Patescibacteria group bacterium]|nr:response regulator [Patescibacteria group bacterium]